MVNKVHPCCTLSFFPWCACVCVLRIDLGPKQARQVACHQYHTHTAHLIFLCCKQCRDKLFCKQIFRYICNVSLLYDFSKFRISNIKLSILPASVHKLKSLPKTEVDVNARVFTSSSALNVIRVSLLQTDS